MSDKTDNIRTEYKDLVKHIASKEVYDGKGKGKRICIAPLL